MRVDHRLIQRLVDGDLSALDQLRNASQEELAAVGTSGHQYALSLQSVARVLREMSLDAWCQNRVSIWAYFVQMGLLPQQAFGPSVFRVQWDPAYEEVIAEVIGRLAEVTDKDDGWLRREERDALLQVVDHALVASEPT